MTIKNHDAELEWINSNSNAARWHDELVKEIPVISDLGVELD